MENPFKISGNAAFVLNLAIRKLKAKVSISTVEREIMLHPNYPSLLAYSDCLSTWQMPNEAFKIDKNTFDISDLDGGFIAHVTTLGGQFMWIDDIADGKITYSDHKRSKVTVSQDEFYEMWDGIILFVETTDKSGEENYREALLRDWFNFLRLPFAAFLLLGTILLNVAPNQHSIYYLLALVKLAGIIVCAILLMHSINSANPFIQNLCGLGKKNDCNAILKSEAAKVTGWLTWSEVGMFYFAGSFLALLANPGSIVYLAYINLLSLPYTIYSIGYQLKAKTWCVLCCTVQALVWLEAFGFFAYGYAAFAQLALSIPNLISFVLSFLTPIAIWIFLKPFFNEAAQLQPTTQQLNRFKYDNNLFKTTLQNQPKYGIEADVTPFAIGNKDATNVITMVSNPFCNPCASAHKTVESLLSFRNDIQLKVVFLTGNKPEDRRTQVAAHVSGLALTGHEEIATLALSDWYHGPGTGKDVEGWKKKYPINDEFSIGDILEKHQIWCTMAEITFTPTFFVNGYKLPVPYRIGDLKYLLE